MEVHGFGRWAPNLTGAAKPRDAVALREAAKPGDCRWRCEKHKSRLKAQGQDSASQGRPATSARSVMTMEAGMTPPARSVKRPARSPLHEMDEDTHDDGSIGLSVATIGNIVRSEIERGLAPVEQKLNHIHNILDERIDKIESTVGEQGLRIDKLEQLVMHAEGTPRSHVSERSVQLENQINDLQSQVAALRTSEPSTQQDYMRTMVIGGLDALPSLQEATTWLTTKLSALQGPSHIGTYMKSQMFQGLLFAKFRNSVDRDTAVALLRSAEMQEKGKRVWATQDLPMMQRVQKVFIMGLRWQLGEWGFMKRDMQWDKFTNLKVGPNVVVTVRISNQKLVCDWSPEWAQWDDLQNSLELKQLIQRANDKLQHSTASKGSGKSKQSFAGMEASS